MIWVRRRQLVMHCAEHLPASTSTTRVAEGPLPCRRITGAAHVALLSRGRSSLTSASRELHLVVGVDGHRVAGVVGEAVVARAQEPAVGQVGETTARPGVVVVGMAARTPWSRNPSGGAAAVAQAEGDALGLGEQPAARPRSRGWDLAPRTTGMIPASHASRRAWPADIREPSSSSAVACSPSRSSQGHRHHDGGVHPGGLRHHIDRVALDVLDERLTHPPTARLPAHPTRRAGSASLWRAGLASASRCALEDRTDVRGDREPAVAATLAVVDHREDRQTRRRGAPRPRGPSPRGDSPTSGATVSRIRFPSFFRSRASCCRASSSNAASACAAERRRPRAPEARRPPPRSPAPARPAGSRRPADAPPRRAAAESRATPSRVSRLASARVSRLRPAHHWWVCRAPTASPNRRRSASATARHCSAATRLAAAVAASSSRDQVRVHQRAQPRDDPGR